MSRKYQLIAPPPLPSPPKWKYCSLPVRWYFRNTFVYLGKIWMYYILKVSLGATNWNQTVEWHRRNIYVYQVSFNISNLLSMFIYNSFMLSHLNYCVAVWGNCRRTKLDKLFELQKKKPFAYALDVIIVPILPHCLENWNLLIFLICTIPPLPSLVTFTFKINYLLILFRCSLLIIRYIITILVLRILFTYGQ